MSTLNTYVGIRTFRKAIIGPEIYEVEHYVLVNGDARLMPSRYVQHRYRSRQATDLDWGIIGPYTLALSHSILSVELKDDLRGEDIALQLYIPFATAHVAALPTVPNHKAGSFRQWVLTSSTIRQWLDQQPITLEQNKLAGF